MKKQLLYIAHLLVKQHEYLYKIVLFSIIITGLVYLFPSGIQFKYTYQKGKPWLHESIIAPFDFSIHKSEEELENERKEIKLHIKRCFVFDNEIYQKALSSFDEQLELGFQKKGWMKKEKYKTIGRSILEKVYEKGIISTNPQNNPYLNEDNDFEIIIVNNGEELSSLGDIPTVETANLIIDQELQHADINDKTILSAILKNSIKPNLFYSEDYTAAILKREIDEISHTHGLVQKGELVIQTGQIVSDNKYQILESLRTEYQKDDEHNVSQLFIWIGHFILIIIVMASIIAFLLLFRKDIFEHNPQLTFILLTMFFTCLMVKVAVVFGEHNFIYAVPVSILALLIKVFYDSRLSLFIHLSTVLILAFWVPNTLEFVFMQLIVGIVAIFSLVNIKNRSQLFITSGLVFISYSIIYFGITISFEGSYTAIQPQLFGKFAINALLLLSAYPLIYIAEKLFGLVSDVSLMELSDTNHPLLRQLAAKAPGTFQHSMQVANLAESAVYKIGGNPLLVRVGALYHDIGKSEMPLYFIENQITGVNPHEGLSFEDSAQIIISHVIKGVEMAKKYKLPDPLIDFIRTHHGTTKVQYFYRSFIKTYPSEKIDEEKFCYPGPSPFTKETAVLMMADSVEAAARSLTKYDFESISSLVKNIIDSQIEQEQFSNANITFKDITVLKKLFIKELLSIYHVRVEYPKI